MPGSHVVDQAVDDLAALAAGAGVVLELVDPGPGPGRRARWYTLHLQPALWGGIDVVRAWGRLGCRSRPRRLLTTHPDEGGARAELRAVVRRRLSRGYGRSGVRGPVPQRAGLTTGVVRRSGSAHRVEVVNTVPLQQLAWPL